MPDPVVDLQVADAGRTYVVLMWKAPLAKKLILYKINYNAGLGVSEASTPKLAIWSFLSVSV